MWQCISDGTLLTTESLLCVSLGKRQLFISQIFKSYHKHKSTNSTVRPVTRAWSGHKLQQWHLTSRQRSQLQTYWKIQSRSVDKGWHSRLRLRGMVTAPKSYRNPALAVQWIFVFHKTLNYLSVCATISFSSIMLCELGATEYRHHSVKQHSFRCRKYGFRNYVPAIVVVKASRPTVAQRWRRADAAPYNENPLLHCIKEKWYQRLCRRISAVDCYSFSELDNRLPQTNTTASEAYKTAEHTFKIWIFHRNEIPPYSFEPCYGRQIPGQEDMFACLSYFWDEGTEIPSENSHLKVLIFERGDIARTSWRVFVVLASLLRQSPARRQWLRHVLHNEFLFVPIRSQDGQWVNHTITDSLPCRLAQDQHNRCRLVHYSADGTDSIKSELGREYTRTISIASDMLIRSH
jgi:hypothetical protein